MIQEEKLTVFEKSQKGQHAYSLPKGDEQFEQFLPDEKLLRKKVLPLPELSEIDLTRHYSGLARKNIGIDTHFYPLGSCTMKLNPRVNEWAAALPQFQSTHPLSEDRDVQGNLRIIYELTRELCTICGMKEGSLAPNAGAQGEFVGIQMIAAYHKKRGELHRTEILVPDNAHGTNPATAAMIGFKPVTIRSDERGDLDLEHLKSLVSEKTAGLMLTNPNTLGVFSKNILEISKIVHEVGGLLYYDGANLNAILNLTRPGDMGFDVMHLNLHKTFSTPHGGGGPGSGPVLCGEKLAPFLPSPKVVEREGEFSIEGRGGDSIGQISTFYGNFGIYLRAYLYLKLHGHAGLRRIAESAILNANYLKKKLSQYFTVPYPQPCMHEFVVQADRYLDRGVRALDIAKRMLDYGVHAPTIYFPLIVKECLLIEPTESESKATLDRFVEVTAQIIEEIESGPENVLSAPHSLYRTRLDEVKAAKNPIVKCESSTRV